MQREHLQRILDTKTVSVLQGRCPKCREDGDLIRAQWKDVFSGLSGGKGHIWSRIAQIDYIIPSIHTFLEDTKLLEPPARIMKSLLPRPCKTTILQEFERMHDGRRAWSLQTTETIFEPQNEASSAAAQHNAYRQLWLYAIRHFPAMTGQPLRKDPGKLKPPRPALELTWWYRFTTLALSCGFTGIDRTYTNEDDVDHKIVEAFLQQVRPPQIYTGSMQSELQQLVDFLKTLRSPEDTGEDTEMQDQGNLNGAIGVPCGPDITVRCGVPFDTAFKKDQAALFLPCIDSPQTHGENIRSFAVKRDIFYSFFGPPECPNHLDPPSQPAPQPSPVINTVGNETLQLQAPPGGLPISSGPPPQPSEVRLIEPHQMDHFSSTRSLDQELFESEECILQNGPEERYITQDEAVQMLLTYQRDPMNLLILEEIYEGRFKTYKIKYNERNKIPKLSDDIEYLTIEPYEKGVHFEERGGKRIKLKEAKHTNPFQIESHGVLFIARRSSKMATIINEAANREAIALEGRL